MSAAEQAREFGLAWEHLPDPRPPFNLEIFMPGGQREFFLLGPHAPNLTANEVKLVHQLWLRFSDGFCPRNCTITISCTSLSMKSRRRFSEG